MKSHRFYLSRELKVADNLILDKQESHHIIQVLKLKPGDTIMLFNGNNIDYQAQIIEIGRRTATLAIRKKVAGISCGSLHTHLYLSISKGDRVDFAIQKSVELGISSITPLITDRTVVKLDTKRLQKRHSHWQQVIISACEQCGRSDIPELHPTQKLRSASFPKNTDRMILIPDAENKLAQQTLGDNICFIIGPEGGLSEKEIEYCLTQQDFQPVSLGSIVLRTETAPLVVLSVLQTIQGDFR